MKKRTKRILFVVIFVTAFVPFRTNPDQPPVISKSQYEEFVRPHLVSSGETLHPFFGLPIEERILLKARTGFDFGGKSLLGLKINFTFYNGHTIAPVPKHLVKDFIHIDSSAWISKDKLHQLRDLFTTQTAN